MFFTRGCRALFLLSGSRVPASSQYSDLRPVRSSRNIACGDTGTAPSQSSTLQHLGPLAPIHTTLYLEILWLQTCKLDTAVDTLIAICTSNYLVLDSNYTRDMDKVQLSGPWL